MPKRTNTAVWMEKYSRWQINVQKDGVRRAFYSSISGRTGQRECNAKADRWLDGDVTNAGLRCQQLYDEWIDELKCNTGTANWKQYDSYGRIWIAPKIGHIKIANITEQHIQNIITEAHKAGRSKKTLSNLLGCIKAFIKYARKRNVTALIVESVYIPRGAPVGERSILQPGDIKILFSRENTIFRGNPVRDLYVNAYRLEVVTGLRPGEIIGLDLLDIKDGKITVKRSINNFGEETRGKNDNARRVLAVTPLADWIIKQQIALLRERRIVSTHLFPDRDGERIAQRTYRKHWLRYQEYNGITANTTPYELRHTFVSVAKNLPEGLLKMIVGHSKDMDTYGVYSHEQEGDLQKAAALLQQLFNGIIEKVC